MQHLFGDSYTDYRVLVLPTPLAQELYAAEAAAMEKRLQEKKVEREIEELAAKKREKDKAEGKSGFAGDGQSAFEWALPWGEHDGPLMQIFEVSEVEQYAANFESECTDSDHRKRARALLRLLERTGAYRKLATIPQDWREDLDRFSAQFPNFAEVIEYIRISCALAERTDGVLHLSILLSGPAGTGKSMFAQTIGRWVGGGYACVMNRRKRQPRWQDQATSGVIPSQASRSCC